MKTITETRIIELDVKNHAGVMMHVTSLFARRAYNVDAILCLPRKTDPARSRVWIRVFEDKCLEQLLRQLEKLEDVLSVKRREAEGCVFEEIEAVV